MQNCTHWNSQAVPAPTKPIRIGFLIGKAALILACERANALDAFTHVRFENQPAEDTDLVEDPKYVGDASFMDDMPDKYRVDPGSKDLCAGMFCRSCAKL